MEQLVRASLQKSTAASYASVWSNVQKFAHNILHKNIVLPLNVQFVGIYMTHLYQLGLQASTIRTHLSASNFKSKPSADHSLPVTLILLQALLPAIQACTDSLFETALISAMMFFAYYGCVRVGK